MTAEAAAAREGPSLGRQAVTWLAIGTQSVGGGASTIYLMRSLLIRRRAWISHAEFLEDWAISRLSPGMHLVALTALLGRRIGGLPGLVVALVAMVGPAAVITAALAAVFLAVRDLDLVDRALAGMGPVVIGLTLGVTLGIARTAMRSGRAGMLAVALLGAAAAVGLLTTIHVIAVIVAGGLVGWVLLGREPGVETAGTPESVAEER
jgi:chromate transporter